MILFNVKKAPVGGIKAAGAGGWHTLFDLSCRESVQHLICLFLLVAGFVLGQSSGFAAVPLVAAGDPEEPLCRMDFVFSGSLGQEGDSVFYLSYSFASDQVQDIKSFVLREVHGRELRVEKRLGSQGNVQVISEEGLVKVILSSYDRFNLPVMVKGEDFTGAARGVRILTAGGERLGGEQLRLRIARSLEPSLYTDPVPAAEPDPSIKNPNPEMP